MFQRYYNHFALAIVSISLLSSCALRTEREFQIFAGNKHTGIVELALDYDTREIPQVKTEQPEELALQRCQMWGYSQAQPIAAPEESCIQNNGSRCLRARLRIQYQCQ